MNFVKRFSCAVAFCFAASIPSWGKTTPPPTPNANYVYVATGGNQIYAVSIIGATAGQANGVIRPGNPILLSTDTFTSLAVGPDNSSDNTGGDSFFLYACSTNNVIIRLQLSSSNPSAPATAVDTVSQGSITGPVCGRVDSAGDLYVSGTVTGTGAGVYVVSGVSGVPGGSPTSSFNSPALALGAPAKSSFAGGGITQKDNGDMLVVDTGDDSILHASFGPNLTPPVESPIFGSLSNYVTGLNTPTAIARISTNGLFVLNTQSSPPGSNNVEEFDPANLSKPTTCTSASGSTRLSSLATSEDDYVYVGMNINGTNKYPQIKVLYGSNCTSAYTTITLSSSSGVATIAALAAPPVAQSPATDSPFDTSTGITSSTYNFGFTILKTQTQSGTSVAQQCAPTVTQQQVPISYLNTLLSTITPDDVTWFGGTPIPYNGEGGFGTLYTVNPNGCSMANTANNFVLAALTDATHFPNPRIIECDPNTSGSGLTCTAPQASGFWPVGGLLPNDYVGGVTKFSKYFVANGSLGNLEAGTFCGFQSPLPSSSLISNPAVVTSTNLSLKFKLGLATTFPLPATCSNGNFVTDATALLSVEQVLDANGKPVFNPITVNTQGNSAPTPPIFKYNSNSQNYQFSLDLSGYQSGTYALIVTLLSDNPLTNNAPSYAPTMVTFIKIP